VHSVRLCVRVMCIMDGVSCECGLSSRPPSIMLSLLEAGQGWVVACCSLVRVGWCGKWEQMSGGRTPNLSHYITNSFIPNVHSVRLWDG
jgi:hypothetical protein